MASTRRAVRPLPVWPAMPTLFAFWLAMLVAAAIMGAPATLAAQDAAPEVAREVAEQARGLFEEGVSLSREERWSEALDAFRRSRALVERPSTLFNIATALQRLGRSSDAIAAVDAFLAVADPTRDGVQVDQARALRGVLSGSLARVTLRLRPGTGAVSVDARPVAAHDAQTDVRELVLDAGEHVLSIEAPGFTPSSLELSLAPGAREEREVVLERLPVTPAELTVRASRSEARIVVDEQTVGTGRAEVAIAAGTHLVRVEAPEHRAHQQIVVLAPAERLEIDARLERVSGGSIAEEPALWIVLACAVAVGAGVGVGVGVGTSATGPEPYGGTSGVAITGLTIPW